MLPMADLADIILRLPPEMLVAIARWSAPTAVTMERVCGAWRSALLSAGDSLWRPLTLARFPRVAGILRASPSGPPPFRALYRDQAKAEAAPLWLKGEEAPRSIDEFVFSIELQQRDACRSVPATMCASWQGALQIERSNPSLEVSIAAVLGGADLQPAAASRHDGRSGFASWWLAHEELDPMQQAGLRETMVMRIFVTRRHYTLRLYEGVATQLRSDLHRARWQTQMLPMPHSRMQGLLDPTFHPFLHPELDLSRGDQEQLSVGRLSLVFSCRDDDTAMNEIEIIDYLDYCLAWPER